MKFCKFNKNNLQCEEGNERFISCSTRKSKITSLIKSISYSKTTETTYIPVSMSHLLMSMPKKEVWFFISNDYRSEIKNEIEVTPQEFKFMGVRIK
jgi:hypothetical protein